MKGKEIRITSLLVLDTIFFLLEAIVGYSVHSLALIADSFHMLNDIISLVIALWAVRAKTTKKPNEMFTYGYQRAEILGALINAVFLIALCFTILMEAIQRFFEPQIIKNPKLILIVGFAGLASNFVGLLLFHEHGHSHSHSHSNDEESHTNDEQSQSYSHSNDSSTNLNDYLPDSVVARVANENEPLLHSHSHSQSQNNSTKSNKVGQKKTKSMNMEGVFLHVLGDALGNVGVILTALFIWKTDYSWRYYSDPLISMVITIIIFSSALPLCRKSSKILLQATPPNINSNKIIQEILKIELIISVHDFHIWNLNEDILIASIHVELKDQNNQLNKQVFLQVVSQVREILHNFGIHSATIQPEFSNVLTLENSQSFGQTTKNNCIVDNIANCDTNCK